MRALHRSPGGGAAGAAEAAAGALLLALESVFAELVVAGARALLALE